MAESRLLTLEDSYKKNDILILFSGCICPLCITDGEIITGEYKRENLPAGLISGLPV